MTLRYKYLGIPCNLDEFLDKECKLKSRSILYSLVQGFEPHSFMEKNFVTGLAIFSPNKERAFIISTYKWKDFMSIGQDSDPKRIKLIKDLATTIEKIKEKSLIPKQINLGPEYINVDDIYFTQQ